jgi:hypothetical protein
MAPSSANFLRSSARHWLKHRKPDCAYQPNG